VSLLKVLRRTPKGPPKPNPMRLPAPAPDADAEKRKNQAAAEELLGIRVLGGIDTTPVDRESEDGKEMPLAHGVRYKRAVFIPWNLPIDWEDDEERIRETLNKKHGADMRAVAYHENSQQDLLFKVFNEYITQGTILLRSVPWNIEPFQERLAMVRGWGNAAYDTYIENVERHALQGHNPAYDRNKLFVRDVLYWGRSDKFIPDVEGDITAAQYGTIPDGVPVPKYNQTAWMLWSVLNRKPISFLEQKGNPVRRAAPLDIEFEWDHYIVDEGTPEAVATGFWHGELKLEMLPRIRDLLDVDILNNVDMRKERIGGKVRAVPYITTILRSSSDVVDGKFPQLESVGRRLRNMGNWSRVKGEDLRIAVQAFVPGSPPLPEEYRMWHWRSIKRGQTFFGELHKKVNAGKVSGVGNFFVGHREERGRDTRKSVPVFLDADSRFVATAIVAQTGAGKTTTGSAILLLQRTPVAFMFQLSTARGEAAPDWARLFGGKVLPIDLPDFAGEGLNDEEIRKEQAKLMLEDTYAAEKLFKGFGKQWESGQPINTPLVILPLTDSLRYLHFVVQCLKYFRAEWERCFVPQVERLSDRPEDIVTALDDPRLGVVFLDDLSKYDVLEETARYGDIPVKVRNEAHQVVIEAINNYRKRGLALIVTTHDYDRFKEFYPVGAFTSLILLGLDEKAGDKTAQILDPAVDPRTDKMRVIAEDVNMVLPPYLLNYVSRLEDKVLGR